MEFNSVFINGLVGVAPNLAVWIVVFILAAIMLRHGGGRAERFIIAGASLKLFSNLLNIPEVIYTSSAVSVYGIVRGVVGMAGTICLVYAFWIRFKARSTAVLTPKD